MYAQVKLRDLMLTDRAKNKMIQLAGHCYNPEKDIIRLVGKRYIVLHVCLYQFTVTICLQVPNKETKPRLCHVPIEGTLSRVKCK